MLGRLEGHLTALSGSTDGGGEGASQALGKFLSRSCGRRWERDLALAPEDVCTRTRLVVGPTGPFLAVEEFGDTR
jgi:hypothetical protein